MDERKEGEGRAEQREISRDEIVIHPRAGECSWKRAEGVEYRIGEIARRDVGDR